MKQTAFPSLLLGLVAGLTIASSSAQTSAPPRYHFEVGQELVYEGSSRAQYEHATHSSTDKTTFWVTRQNADQSWHIIAYNTNTFGSLYGTNATSVPVPQREKQETLTSFDLYPDGRVTNPPESFREKRLLVLFPSLPTDVASAERGWQQVTDDGDKSLFKLDPQSDTTAGKWLFSRVDKRVEDEIYLATLKAVIQFDAKRGLTTKVDSENTQGYGAIGKDAGVMELKSESKKDAEWMAQLDRETGILQAAKNSARGAYKILQNNGESEQAAMTDTENSLRAWRDKMKLPIIVAQFDAEIKQLKSSASYSAKEKKRDEEALNKPAADWSIEDIDGKTHALADYRGKVVVLDFWYRGCGWCIKAMPQVKEVTSHYEGKPVAVLGMNTDHEVKDARFVVNKLNLNYTTLKAEGLPEKYGVEGFPTLVIIDQKGVVRGRHVGYSPTLREELIKQIDGLLAGGN